MPSKDPNYAHNRYFSQKEAYLDGKFCKECKRGVESLLEGERLEIHHLDFTTRNASINWSWGMDRINKELEKCIVLCSYCHNLQTNTQKNSRVKHGTLTMYVKKKCRCEECSKVWSDYHKAYRKKNPKRYR